MATRVDPVARTLMLTTRCSAGCSHCPFASPDMPGLDLSVDEVLKWIAQDRAGHEPVVISGGEPCEHPALLEILAALQGVDHPVRFATGGFHDLRPFLAALIALPRFSGVSLGTDTISRRNPDAQLHAATWRANVALLEAASVPYSITITTLRGDEFIDDVLRCVTGVNPEFLYLRADHDSLARSLAQLRKHWPARRILIDRLD